jgi:hypothetical protein
MKLPNIAFQRPSRDDVLDLGPAIAVFVAWFALTDRSMRRNATSLVPAAFGVAAWLVLKGTHYVPR